MINLEYYKVFYYVASAGSLTLAAGRLSISQPAVSQSIRQLEQQLGTSLFRRTSKGVSLTPEGEVLYAYVSKGYEQFVLGEQKLQQLLNMDSGEIRIGASDMTLQFYLLPYLEEFHEKYPRIKVTVTNAPTPETLVNLQNGQIDFGVVSTPFEQEPGIHSVPVREIEDIFVAGRRFIQYKNRMLDLQKLENLPIIQLEQRTSSRSYMDAFLLQNNIVIRSEFELATSDMIVQFALRNLGIGCVVKDFALPYIESGQLFELRFKQLIPKRHFCIVTDETKPKTIAGKNLLEIMLPV